MMEQSWNFEEEKIEGTKSAGRSSKGNPFPQIVEISLVFRVNAVSFHIQMTLSIN